ncbi:MAG: tetratricopeptide repeat protein [Clostridiales bacterium]|jgi:tetratricopeptide (TPR) repeat protein|nr:tetratricopeptide repeat protein [Clostridiales bacterium]
MYYNGILGLAAIAAHKLILNFFAYIYGENDLRVSYRCNTLKELHYVRGEYETALEYARRNLDINEYCLGTNNYLVEYSYYAAGEMACRAERYDESRRAFLRALSIHEDRAGEDDDSVYFYEGCHYWLGWLAFNAGEYAEALSYYEKLLELRSENAKRRELKENEKPVSDGDVFCKMADAHYRIGNHNEAAEFYEKAVPLFKEMFGQSSPEISDLYYNLGKLYRDELEDGKTAETWYKTALEVAENRDGKYSESAMTALVNIGFSRRSEGDFDGAAQSFRRALDVHRRVFGNKATIYSADIYGFIAGSLAKAGSLREAENYYVKSAETEAALEEGDGGRDGRIKWMAGEVASDIQAGCGDEAALAFCGKYLKGDSRGAAAVYASAAWRAYEKDEYDEAERLYLKAEETALSDEYNETYNFERLYYEMMNARLAAEDLDGAEKYGEKALEHAGKSENLEGRALILRRLSDACGYYERDADALRYLLARKEVIAELHGANSLEAADCNLGIECAYETLGDYDKLRETAEENIRILEKLGNPKNTTAAISYENRGCSCESDGEYEKAMEYLKKSLAIQEEAEGGWFSHIYYNIFSVYTKMGDLESAEKYMKLCFEAADREELSEYDRENYFESAARFRLKKGEPGKARECAERAYNAAAAVTGEKAESAAKATILLANAARDLGETDEARALYEKALITVFDLYGKEHQMVAEIYVETARMTGNAELLEKALEIREKRLKPGHPLINEVKELLREEG